MKIVLTLTSILILFTACKKNKNELIDEVVPKTEIGNFNLVFPDNNLICTEGNEAGNNEVAINFMWTNASNATSYAIEIMNLDTDETLNFSSTTTSKEITLTKDTQFSWSVTAELDDTVKKSTTWNFYTEGTAVENFAPFPATITAEDKANGIVTISWEGADLDNDIATYDIFFGTDKNNLDLVLTTDTEESIDQPISYGTTYFIEVISTDDRGNTSKSNKTINF